jgi:DNA repair exonuclease SbcCD ATPase subunit
MITIIRARNWRVYSELELELGEGTTFVVASNAVGKSSLLEAAAWALYGAASGIDPNSAIRAGESQAEVELTISTLQGPLHLRRTVDDAGATALVADLAGTELTDDTYTNAIEQAFGASVPVAARLTFLTDKGTLSHAAGEFAIRDHLAAAFGVKQLLDGAQAAEAHLRAASRDRQKLRKSVSQERKTTEALRSRLGDLEKDVVAAEMQRDKALERVQDMNRARHEQEVWHDYRIAHKHHQEQVTELRADVKRLIGKVEADSDPMAVIAKSEDVADRSLAEARMRSAAITAQAEAEAAAVALLREATGVCPTCLRPLAGDDMSDAIHTHHESHERLVAEREVVAAKIDRLQMQLKEWRALAHRATTLVPPIPPDAPEPSIGREAVQAADTALSDAAQHLERIKAQRDVLAQEIDQAEQAESLRIQQIRAYRREALAEAAQRTLMSTADRYMEESILPLTAEVAHRWKRLFGSGEGLQLNPDGSIVMNRRGRALTFDDLSGGERISALLVTRLLVLTASTTAGFAWLDEPLEHLDPRRRRTLAVTLAKATRSRALRQIVVTTYEEGLARQLAASTTDIQLRYVKAEPVT